MGNRIIKESICASPDIDELSWFEEVFFYRLIVNCDDFGRFDGRAAIIKARLFPLKDIRPSQVEEAINKLSSVGIVDRYIANGQSYLQIVTWAKHQQVRNRKSRYPEPEEKLSTVVERSSVIKCNQLISTDINCVPNPIQSESNKNPIQNNTIQKELLTQKVVNTTCSNSCCFDDFWEIYPKKTDLAGAKAAYNALIDIGIFDNDIFAAVNACKREKVGVETKYYKKPADFLAFDCIKPYLPKYLRDCTCCGGNGYVHNKELSCMEECSCKDRYNGMFKS